MLYTVLWMKMDDRFPCVIAHMLIELRTACCVHMDCLFELMHRCASGVEYHVCLSNIGVDFDVLKILVALHTTLAGLQGIWFFIVRCGYP